MHYTPSNLRAFLTDEEAAQSARDLGPWPLYILTAVVGVLSLPDTLAEITGWQYFQNWQATLGSFTVSMSLAAAFLGGMRVLYVSLEGLFEGKVGADLAVAVACVAAIVLGETWVAAEVVFIALLGECLEGYIYTQATRAIRQILDLAPPVAHVKRGGVEVTIPLHEVQVDETAVVYPGERVPVDGIVLAGNSAIDQSALTGESIPLDKQPGDTVFAGTMNQFGAVEIRATRVGRQTTLGQVLQLVADAQINKAPLERQADLYARWFLPCVLLAAAVTFLISNWGADTWRWNPTLSVLVVACPCALILATPAAVLAAMSWLAHRGVVIKGSVALERLAQVDRIAFDKTGTLTTGSLRLTRLLPCPEFTELDLLRWSAAAELRSEHPLGKLVVAEAKQRQLELPQVVAFQYFPGQGIQAEVKESGEEFSTRQVHVGSLRFLAEQKVELLPEMSAMLAEADQAGETPLVVAVDGKLAGLLVARDTVRAEAADVLADLRKLGIEKLALVSGDRQAVARRVAQELGGFEEVVAEQLPAEKAHWLQAWRGERGMVAMMGDGINDAPALAVSDVGLALGGTGSDLAAEAGDVVLLGDPLRPLPGLVRLSRQLVVVIRQNILWFAFGVNVVAILLANFGWLSPVAAAFYHLGGSVLVLMNSMRLLWFERWHETWLGRWLASLDQLAEQLSLAAVVEFFEIHGLKVLKAAAAAALLVWAAWNVHLIEPDERAVVTRYGRYRTTLEPGLIWRLPPPLETVYRIRPWQIRSFPLGLATNVGEDNSNRIPMTSIIPQVVEWDTVHDAEAGRNLRDASLLLTGDEVLVEIAATVNYRLKEDGLKEFLFEVSDPEAILHAASEHALRTVAARRSLDKLLTGERAELESETLKLVQSLMQQYQIGVEVVDVLLGDIHPPLEVVGSYREVASAYEDRQTLMNEAEANYYSTVLDAGGQAVMERLREENQAEKIPDWPLLLQQAGGRAAETLEQARIDRLKRTLTSQGETERFLLRLSAYQTAPALTQTRLYWETLARTYKDRPVWILDPQVVGQRRLMMTEPGMNFPFYLPNENNAAGAKSGPQINPFADEEINR